MIRPLETCNTTAGTCNTTGTGTDTGTDCTNTGTRGTAGDGTLATLTFEVLALTPFGVHLTDVILSDATPAALAVRWTDTRLDGTLASVTFSVVAVKASTLRLTGVLLSDSNANALSVSVRNGNVVERRAAKWDVNGDGRVNVLDLTRVATRLGRRDASADTNGDGIVNVLDLVVVAQHLGETVGPTTPTVPVTPEPQPTVPQPPLVDPYEDMERIPAGEFRMGSNSGASNERPVHSVYVDEFYMDTYEVLNGKR